MQFSLKWTVSGAVLVAAAVVGVLALSGTAVRADPGPVQPRAAPTIGIRITVQVPQPVATPTATQTDGGSTGGGGSLPRTGEPIALVAGVGLVLLGLGTAIRALARRRPRSRLLRSAR